jgi:hypothetical protein
MYLVMCHETSLQFSYPQVRFENNNQLIVLITTDIKYLSYADNYLGEIQFLKYVIVLHISTIPHAAINLNIC